LVRTKAQDTELTFWIAGMLQEYMEKHNQKLRRGKGDNNILPHMQFPQLTLKYAVMYSLAVCT